VIFTRDPAPSPQGELPKQPEKPFSLISEVPEEAFRAKLLANEPVQVLGPLGKPAHLRWCIGENHAKVHEWGTDGAFTITSDGLSMLEILDQVPLEKYVFSVETRANDRYASPGIAIGHQTVETPRGHSHFLISYVYSEARPGPPNQGRREVCWLHHARFTTGDTTTSPYARANLIEMFPNKLDGNGPVWRKLSVRVTPDVFEFYWGDELFRAVDRKRDENVITGLSGIARALQPLPIDFQKHNGVGVLVRGSVSFQNAVLFVPKD
jgi:hypothetical protein